LVLLAFFAVEEIGGLLPLSFAFAAGAMLALIVVEMLPTAFSGRARIGPCAGILAGTVLMLALSLLLGV
jgi:zinc transporter ZupT